MKKQPRMLRSSKSLQFDESILDITKNKTEIVSVKKKKSTSSINSNNYDEALKNKSDSPTPS